MRPKKILFIITLVILLGVFIFSATYVLDYYINSAKQKGEFDELASMVESVQAQQPTESQPLFDPDGEGQTLPTEPTEPEVTEPTEPEATEPPATEPPVTEPPVTEPEEPEQDHMGIQGQSSENYLYYE